MAKQTRISDHDLIDKILATQVGGTIVLTAQSGKLDGFTCRNITVVATSEDLVPHAPREFAQPKWVRTGRAKRIRGKCIYSINVPFGSEFYLTAVGEGRFACTSIDVFITPTGAAIGPIVVRLGAKKVVDLTVSRVTCNVLA